MRQWTVDQWISFIGALGIFVGAAAGAIATAAVKIINALRGVENRVSALEVKVDGRLEELLARVASDERAKGVEAGRGEIVVPIASIPPTITLGTVPEEKKEKQ